MQINADMEADLSSLLFFYLLSCESVGAVATEDERGQMRRILW